MSSTLTRELGSTIDLLTSPREQEDRQVLNEDNQFRVFVNSWFSGYQESDFLVVNYPRAYSGRNIMFAGSNERCTAETALESEIDPAEFFSGYVQEQLAQLISEPVSPGDQPVKPLALKAVIRFLRDALWRLPEPDISPGPNGEIGLTWWPVDDGIISLEFEGARPRLSALFPRVDGNRRAFGPRDLGVDEAAALVLALLVEMQ